MRPRFLDGRPRSKRSRCRPRRTCSGWKGPSGRCSPIWLRIWRWSTGRCNRPTSPCPCPASVARRTSISDCWRLRPFFGKTTASESGAAGTERVCMVVPGATTRHVDGGDRGEGMGQLSLSRLNHWLPGRQTYPEVVQGTAEFHDEIADARLPQAEGVPQVWMLCAMNHLNSE